MENKIYVYLKRGEDFSLIEELLQKASKNRSSLYDLYTDSARDYITYRQLQKDILKEPGILIISSIDSIGSNKNDVYKELLWLKENHIETVFADYPSTHIFDNPCVNELALNILLDIYVSLLDNKNFDIRSKITTSVGRKKILFPNNWEILYEAWSKGEINGKEFREKCGLKKGTFYHLINEYKEILEINKNNLKFG